VKTFFAPHLNRHVKLGRHAPVSLGPHLRLSRYLTARLPPAPSSADYSADALPSLRDIMGNDTLGDCVIASANHVQGVVTGNAGALVQATLADIIKQYSAIGGFDPNNPIATDQGCDEVTALNWYVANGFADGVKPLGWVYIDGANADEVKSAISLFEHLIICTGLPDSWVSPFPSGDGFTWGASTPDPNNGHSYMAVGYDTRGARIDTWGLFGTQTYAALAQCSTTPTGGGCYCILTPEMLTKGATKAPNGVAWSDLISDFDSLGGNIPAPNPTPPTPVTPPAPSGSTVTRDQAQAWLDAALASAHPLLTRSQAKSIVDAALAANWPS
jgi:hypothetical protein